MKILHINDHLALKGGVEVYLLSLARELSSRGHKIGIAYGSGDPSVWSTTYSVPAISSVALRNHSKGRQEMAEAISKFEPDVCHVHGVYNPGVIDACLNHGPTVLHLHDYRYMCPSSGFFYRRSRNICERTCSVACFPIGLVRGCQTPRLPAGLAYLKRVKYVERHAGRFQSVLANSQFVAERFSRATSMPSSLCVAHYFCPIAPAVEPPSAKKHSSILFLGRVREIKGIVPFLEVLSLLPKGVTGTIVGDPDQSMKTLIERESKRLGCHERIRLTGWLGRNDVARIVEQASAVLFPSLWAEPFGIVGIEAMARGIPVVGFDVGGVSDWLVDGETGYLVPRNDVAQMAERVKTLLSDSELRTIMGRKGIELVRKKFCASDHVEKLIATYQREEGFQRW